MITVKEFTEENTVNKDSINRKACIINQSHTEVIKDRSRL